MENITFTENTNNYNDYAGREFFESYGVENVEFTKKIAEVGGAKVILTHVEGTRPDNRGQFLNLDLWPNRCATLDDIKLLPDTIEDVKVRFGKYVDPETGEVYESSTPKIAAFKIGGKWCSLHGDKPEFDDEAQRSVWSNEPAKSE